MKKKVEYSREQAEQMALDFNEYIGIKAKLYQSDIDFLRHKFPPKIDYVGKVWKDEEAPSQVIINGIEYIKKTES